MSNTLLIVDGENLLHRSYHKFLNLKSSGGNPSGAIFGFFKSLHSVIFRFNPTSVIVTFDNGRSKYRTKILPDYKGGRKKLGMDYESLQSQKVVIRKILKLMCIPVIYDKKFTQNYEADDYIAWMTILFPGKSWILSSDKDFDQMISSSVRIINPSKDNVITTANCLSLKGYEPNECVDYLALVGDTSDSVPGVKGIGPKKAREFLDNYGSIANYVDKDKDKVNSTMARALFIGNNLIDLRYFLKHHPISISDIPIKMGSTIKLDKLNKIFIKYSLSSFKSKEFLSTFQKLIIWQPGK